ncbi:helix-turn-helix domain-containing protein [Yeguia hominis]|uniref:Helix-turn-helix transcriptional regulator n=1 Tax=Yeguia hominis TaxID=2763662 RepID=A0A926HSJ5_9FIRM|nr:helix-turn-helix transcriptional regulator [Yeguia hominis]MBC8533900.1 helix-turn-helix transcriptional regulator [Yeguia hominis]
MYFPRIEELRIDHDLTQKQLSEYLHCNREVYRRYEKGRREIPVWAVIMLAKLYNTTTDYILGMPGTHCEPPNKNDPESAAP